MSGPSRPQADAQREAIGLLRKFCRENDQAAFSRFYRLHARRLWRFLIARGSDEEGAYDLLSTVFMRFVSVVCADLGSPLGLLYRIAVNAHIDSYRRRRASLLHGDPEAVERASTPQPERADELEHVRELLRRLAPSEQNLLLMRYWIGLTHKEIAVALERPEGTVRRECAEALQALRRRWEAGE